VVADWLFLLHQMRKQCFWVSSLHSLSLGYTGPPFHVPPSTKILTACSYCSSNLGVAVGVWTRVLLPQILGQELPEVVAQNQKPVVAAPLIHKLGPSGVEAALGYMEDTLAASTPVARASGKVGLHHRSTLAVGVGHSCVVATI